MTMRTYVRVNRARHFDPEDVHRFLAGRGADAPFDSIGCGVESGQAFVRVDTTLTLPELTAHLDAYRTTEDSDRAQAVAALRATVQAIAAKPPATRTDAEKGVLAIAQILRELVAEVRG